MRYVVMILIVIISILLVFGVFTSINLWDIAPDTILLSIVAMVLLEKTLMPVLFFSVGTLFMDILFARAIGFYTIPYLVAGLAVYLFFKNRPPERKPWIPALAAGGGVLIKELLTAFLCLILRYNFHFGTLFIRYTLPSVVLNGLLMIPVFLLFRALYRKNFMRPQQALDERMPF